MKISGAIFDLDGTLLDSMPIWDHLGEDYLKGLGLFPHENLNLTLKNMSLFQAAQYLKSEYHLLFSPDTIIKDIDHMVDDFYQNTVCLKKGVKKYLSDLASRNIPMCLATASDFSLAKAALHRNGILSYFPNIITCTMAGCGKDDPAIFEKALSLLQTKKEETFIFEDSLHAITTAKKSGFPTVGVFDASSIQDQENIKNLADYYIRSLDEMRRFLP